MSLSGSTNQPSNRTGDGPLRHDEPKGPEPTPENPGGVFPQVDPKDLPASGTMPGGPQPDHGGDARGVFSNVSFRSLPPSLPTHNGQPRYDLHGVYGYCRSPRSRADIQPLMFKDIFQTLSSAFTTAIYAVEDESRSGVGSVGKALVDTLKERRAEIDGWLQGKNVPGAEGGEKTDEVERKEGKATGLYKD